MDSCDGVNDRKDNGEGNDINPAAAMMKTLSAATVVPRNPFTAAPLGSDAAVPSALPGAFSGAFSGMVPSSLAGRIPGSHAISSHMPNGASNLSSRTIVDWQYAAASLG